MNDRLGHAKHSPYDENVTHNPLGRLPRHTTTTILAVVGASFKATKVERRAFGLFSLWSERRGDWWQRLGTAEEGESAAAFFWKGRSEGRLDGMSGRSSLLAGFCSDSADDVDPVEPFFQINGIYECASSL